MDARDRLRRYLEQRREMGESEFALDSMSIEEAMTVMGGPGKTGAPPKSRTAAPDVSQAAPSRVDEGPAPSASTDWRDALRASGATPAPKLPATPVPIEGAAGGPTLDLPPGLVVAKPAAPGVSDIEALPSLDAIAEMVRRCTRCPLHMTAIQGVPGEGNPDARFVVVGEAPGATEDETGRPFVGAAGQLLTKILAAINLRREDVFICNVIKHRPPGNRNPLPNEIAACSPYLIRQLELIRPGVILALGTFAAQTLLETKEAWDDVQLARRILDSSPDARA